MVAAGVSCVRVPMTEQRKHFPEFYVTAPQPCPYLPGRLERKLFTHLTHEKSPVLVDNLLQGRLPAQPEHRLHALLRGLPGLRVGARAGRRVRADPLHAARAGEQWRSRRPAPAGDAHLRAVLAVPRLHRRAPRRRRHGRHDGARLRHDGGGQHHRHLHDRVPARSPSRCAKAPTAGSRWWPPRCATGSRTASPWSTASTSRRPPSAGSAPT